jgi:DNA topoisomerase 2-associated protein PAT1
LQFRSKYMTSEEIESILKMQHSNSHSSDPYVNDYYHQARLAKKSSGSRTKPQLYPSHLKDHQSRSRNSSDQQPQVHVDALGKITLPSICRPRALLEVDSPPSSGHKHLEDEPLVAARVTIEDAFGVLIDIVDIDRTLQFNRPQDGGAQLRRKRQILLEGLATSLQLVDPFSKTGQKTGLTTKDDIVFLRITTLPKGRKLLTKYLQLLVPGTEIARVVCMAVFRHLRFLFGGLPSDSLAAETIANLAKAVTVCVQAMDLRALSACLAAVVCSSEQPPLRPIGSSSGDGASVVLVSLLERAAEVIVAVVPPRVSNHGNPNDGLWRASFDEFFSLLTKYCRSKYETIHGQNHDNAADVLELAIKREMPAELLRASLRHTNEDQRNFLLNVGRSASPVSESTTTRASASGGQINSEFVRG